MMDGMECEKCIVNDTDIYKIRLWIQPLGTKLSVMLEQSTVLHTAFAYSKRWCWFSLAMLLASSFCMWMCEYPAQTLSSTSVHLGTSHFLNPFLSMSVIFEDWWLMHVLIDSWISFGSSLFFQSAQIVFPESVWA